MDAHLIDSAVFGHLWSSASSREVFGERARMNRWIAVIAALARAQAQLQIIPAKSAAAIDQLTVDDLDLANVVAGTRATAHSTLGLIHELQRLLPESARDHVYVGATVQDITDSALALEMAAIAQTLWSDLWTLEAVLLDLATVHRSTPMTGRTHGQPGAPITFGFKVASWLDELGRNLVRLQQGRDRWLVGQLGGAVGTLAFFENGAGLDLRRRFCVELGLAEPLTSWTSTRDRLAEFANVTAVATAGLARLANEVYSLQRAEVGELTEATTATTVGSITMPHKRNPEFSEQVVTLARLVRVQAGLLTETMVQEHERDARGWKAEWVAFPELCHYATAATALGLALVRGIEVNVDTMAANLAGVTSIRSEQALRRLTPEIGKHRAQTLLHDGYREARETGRSVEEVLGDAGVPLGFDRAIDVGAAASMTDAVVAGALARRANESHTW